MYIIAIIAFVLGIPLFVIGYFLLKENEVKKSMIKAGIMLIAIAAMASCCYGIFRVI
ncbi:MAG: hypothetical protein UHN47_03535 [Lachnospiraceae bacterium]|nr:hypothetical protein [Lachnospiraceae bacterium]